MPAQPRPETTAPRPAAPVTDRDKARALLALLGPEASKAGLTVSQEGNAPVPPADLRAIARDLIAQVERKRAARTAPPPPAPPVPPIAATEYKAPAVTRAAPMPPPAPVSPEATGPSDMLDIPEEAPETAAPDTPPLVLSEREMILPTFASRPRGGERAGPAAGSTSLFSKRAPLTLSVPRSEGTAGRLTLSAPSSFAPGAAPTTRVTAPMLDRAKLKALIARTVKPHRLAAEHPTIVALTLDGLTPLNQAEALRKLPHGQRRRIHRALRQIETATA